MHLRICLIPLIIASIVGADLPPFSSSESREFDERMKVLQSMWEKVFELRRDPHRTSPTKEENELLKKIETYQETNLTPLSDAVDVQKFFYYRKESIDSFLKNAALQSEQITTRQFELAPEKLEFKTLKLGGWSFVDVHGDAGKLPKYVLGCGIIPVLPYTRRNFGSIDAADDAGHELKGIVFYKPELLDVLVKLKPGNKIDMLGFTFKDDAFKWRIMIVTVTVPGESGPRKNPTSQPKTD